MNRKTSDVYCCSLAAYQYHYQFMYFSGKSNILVDKTAGTYSVRTLNKGCLSNESQKLFTTVKPSPSKPVISLKDNLLHSSALAGNQWYLNDSIIPGATAPEYKPLTNGN